MRCISGRRNDEPFLFGTVGPRAAAADTCATFCEFGYSGNTKSGLDMASDPDYATLTSETDGLPWQRFGT